MTHLMTGAVVEAGVLARMNLETTGTPRVSTLSVCLSVHLSACLSVCLSVCLTFFLSAYISTFSHPSLNVCVWTLVHFTEHFN